MNLTLARIGRRWTTAICGRRSRYDAAEIADFLCRDIEEVRERARQVGLRLPGPRELN
jgi:hypothetical protein